MNILCILLLLVSSAIAEDSIMLSGVVTSDGIAPVADATVVLEAGPNGIVRAAGSTADGSFRIEGLSAGHYVMWAAAKGHTVERREIILKPSEKRPEIHIELRRDNSAGPWQVDPQDRQAFREATQLLADYKAREALEKFETFLSHYPYLVRAHYNVGLCHVELAAVQRDRNRGEATEYHERLARSHFSVVLERYSDYTPALVALAESSVRSLEMEKAETVYQRLLKLNPNEAEQWYTYAEVLAYLQKLPESKAAFEQVLKIDPLYFDAQARIGAIEMTLGNYSEAIRRFETFLAAAPKSDMAPLTRELLKESKQKAMAEQKSPLEQ